MNIKARINNYLKKRQHPNLKEALNVPSHMTLDERITLYQLTLEKRTQYALEIGSYIGASARSIGQAMLELNQGTLCCVDTWNNDAMTEGNKDTFTAFSENTRSVNAFLKPIRGFSTEVVEQAEAITSHLDLLFIDGDHSYEGVKADWECYKHFLKPGSIVVFHDYGWAEGVKQVIREDVESISRNHNSLPNMWWAEITG